MEKLVIIINGAGGVGKDTICGILSEFYRVKIISSIDPIREIAQRGGWEVTDKSKAGRRLLSDLKAAFVRYNNLPTRYLIQKYHEFLSGADEILCVHIREPDEIIKFREELYTRNITLLITSNRVQEGSFGNQSDDHVREFQYDYIYHNDKSKLELRSDFPRFFEDNILPNL